MLRAKNVFLFSASVSVPAHPLRRAASLSHPGDSAETSALLPPHTGGPSLADGGNSQLKGGFVCHLGSDAVHSHSSVAVAQMSLSRSCVNFSMDFRSAHGRMMWSQN